MIDPKELRHDHYLDLTTEVCPMTFVRAKLLMEAAAPGEVALFRVNAGETLENMPASLHDQGFTILAVLPCQPADSTGPHHILVARR